MDTKDWKEIAGGAGAVKQRSTATTMRPEGESAIPPEVMSGKRVPPPAKVPPEDDVEMRAIVAAARIRMTRGEEQVAVPIADVAARKLEGWVIAGQQG